MFHIYALAATRASDVVKIEKVRFLDCDIGFFIFKNRVAAGANNFPHLFPVIVFYNFHTSCCFGYTLIYAKGVPNWFQARLVTKKGAVFLTTPFADYSNGISSWAGS